MSKAVLRNQRLQRERVGKRLGMTAEAVALFAKSFSNTEVIGIISYLDQRLAVMHGDENPAYELQQIRLDLASLKVISSMNLSQENIDEIR